MGAPEALEITEFAGEDASLKIHTNKLADSNCQGVYFHHHLGCFSVIAPGGSWLGYYAEAKDAALAFSRHVATITRNLGRKAITRPWPRLPIDRRRYHTLTLTSCGLERPTDDKTANLWTLESGVLQVLAHLRGDLCGSRALSTPGRPQ